MTKARNYDSHSVDSLNLTPRTRNALARAGYTRVGQVMKLRVEDILGMHALGIGSLSDIINAAEQLEAEDLAERVRLLEEEVRVLREGLRPSGLE